MLDRVVLENGVPTSHEENLPNWIKFDKTLKTVTVAPPENYSDDPFIELALYGHKSGDMVLTVEYFIVVVSTSCIDKCPFNFPQERCNWWNKIMLGCGFIRSIYIF
eukprot:UN10822